MINDTEVEYHKIENKNVLLLYLIWIVVLILGSFA